ncbi:hypothetical protein Bca52824_063895 [Brassica carinata]|uniref:Uncharacterized protein n=1 Tax=Brassica carinata TaxID=52824 RepID=A0A8X7U7N8_BRACI|nr:hypothetical protein Bca52824_063895 [Brassica carinata]
MDLGLAPLLRLSVSTLVSSLVCSRRLPVWLVNDFSGVASSIAKRFSSLAAWFEDVSFLWLMLMKYSNLCRPTTITTIALYSEIERRLKKRKFESKMIEVPSTKISRTMLDTAEVVVSRQAALTTTNGQLQTSEINSTPGACDLRASFNRSKPTDLRRRLEQAKGHFQPQRMTPTYPQTFAPC